MSCFKQKPTENLTETYAFRVTTSMKLRIDRLSKHQKKDVNSRVREILDRELDQEIQRLDGGTAL